MRQQQVRAVSRLSILGALLLGACASGTPPTAELAVANSTIAEAERAGAVQQAPVELNEAKRKVAAAQAAGKDDNYREAGWLASEAEADAKLANVKTQASLAQQSASQVQQGINALQQEATPQSAPPAVAQ